MSRAKRSATASCKASKSVPCSSKMQFSCLFCQEIILINCCGSDGGHTLTLLSAMKGKAVGKDNNTGQDNCIEHSENATNRIVLNDTEGDVGRNDRELFNDSVSDILSDSDEVLDDVSVDSEDEENTSSTNVSKNKREHDLSKQTYRNKLTKDKKNQRVKNWIGGPSNKGDDMLITEESVDLTLDTIHTGDMTFDRDVGGKEETNNVKLVPKQAQATARLVEASNDCSSDLETVKISGSTSASKWKRSGGLLSSAKSNVAKTWSKLTECHVVLRDIFEHNQCDVCGKKLKSLQDVEAHLKQNPTHSGCFVSKVKRKQQQQGSYLCDLCEKSFTLKRYLRNHERKIHKKFQTRVSQLSIKDPKLKKCSSVNNSDFSAVENFEINENMKRYQKDDMIKKPIQKKVKEKNVSSNQNIPCETCGKVCTTKDFKRHLKTHQQEKGGTDNLFFCEKCGRSYSSLRSLKLHLEEHAKIPDYNAFDTSLNKKWPCNICGEVFVRKKLLSKHRDTVHSLKPFACDQCPKAFLTEAGLRVHKSMNHERTDVPRCDQCQRVFKTSSNLNMHRQLVHEGLKPFSCETCGKKYTNRKNLKRHKQLHTGNKPFGCQICEKRFFQKVTMIDHMAIHKEVKEFSCNQCERQFGTRASLNRHIKDRHSSGKGYKRKVYSARRSGGLSSGNYPCTFCGKMLTSKFALINHQRIHTGERPYVCNLCDKSYAYKVSLTYHMAVHAGEKKFQCHMCPKKFGSIGNRIRHEEIHKGIVRFKCEPCDHYFRQKIALQAHCKTHKHLAKVAELSGQCQGGQIRVSPGNQLTPDATQVFIPHPGRVGQLEDTADCKTLINHLSNTAVPAVQDKEDQVMAGAMQVFIAQPGQLGRLDNIEDHKTENHFVNATATETVSQSVGNEATSDSMQVFIAETGQLSELVDPFNGPFSSVIAISAPETELDQMISDH